MAQTTTRAPAKPAAGKAPAGTAAKATGTAVAKADEAHKGGLPAEYDFGDDAGKGTENMGADEQILPFLRILQANSPQIVENTLEGAKPGMILNTATNELFTSLELLFVARDHNFVKYVPRDSGGGFVGILDKNDEIVRTLRQEQGQFGKLLMDGGEHELVETFYLFSFAKAQTGQAFRAILPFASTQIKAYKGLMTRVTTELVYDIPGKGIVHPPLWAHRWRAGTVLQKNKKGSFYGWDITLAGGTKENSLLMPKDAIYKDAKLFNELISSGQAKVDYGKQGGPETEVSDEDPPM